METSVRAKWQAFKAWKPGKGTSADYDLTKLIAKHIVHHAQHEADKAVYENIDPVIVLPPCQPDVDVDVVGDKLVKSDAGKMSMSEVAKQKA